MILLGAFIIRIGIGSIILSHILRYIGSMYE
nr:MAG TPA: hypothetical protein [Caudoviricetes sp.]